MPPFQPDEKYWKRCEKPNGTVLYKCRVCADGRERASYNCKAHEGAQSHLTALRLSEVQADTRGNSLNMSLFDLNQANIRAVTKEVIYQANRKAYKNIHLDVEKKIRAKADLYSMENVFSKPAREEAFSTVTKRLASSVRNHWRTEIRDSITGSNKCSLAAFTLLCAQKYRPSDLSTTQQQGYLVRNALLRRFALENLGLLSINEDEDSSSPSLPSNEDDSLSSSESSEIQPLRKRRKASGKMKKSGRIPDGEDFWSQVDSWFERETEKREKDLLGPLWKEYIDETIMLDNNRFAPTPMSSINQQSVGNTTTSTAVHADTARHDVPLYISDSRSPDSYDDSLHSLFQSV